MDYPSPDSSMAAAAGLLQRCRLLTMSAGTTDQTWSMTDYLINFSDVRLTKRVIGSGRSTKVEEAELYGMLCALKTPYTPPEPNAITKSDETSATENEGSKILQPGSGKPPKFNPETRGWSLSTTKSAAAAVRMNLPLRKIRSHSFEPSMDNPATSLNQTSRVNSSVELDGFSKILKECRMLSTLHHPNIVLFYGVCWLEEDDQSQKSPAIVEELMLLSLREVTTSFKEKLDGGVLPLAMKLSLLSDTARGLAYLHNHAPSIIHPNLESHDVMISSAMVAKITDLCNAQYGSTRHQDILAFGMLAALTMGLSPNELAGVDKEKFTEVESDLISYLNLCFSADVQARPSTAKLLDKLEKLAKRVPFQLNQMGTMMSAIKEWRHETKTHSPTQVDPPAVMVPSPSLDELLKDKDRQLVELKEKNSELLSAKEKIEKRLAEQEEQLQALPADSDEVKLSDMLAELYNVVGWFLLGIHLGLPLSDLQKIRHQSSESVDQCKTEMLITYSKLKEPSWTEIVEALRKCGEHALALRLAQKHGVPLPEATEEQPSESTLLPNEASETEVEVQKLVGTIRAKDNELQNTIQQLQIEQATKENLEKELALLKDSLSLIDVQSISANFQQTRQTLSQQLFLKERERHYLSLMGMSQQNHKAEKSMHGNEIEVILVEKDKEINRMRAQLKEVEVQFSKEKDRSEELKTKLALMESELTIKSAHIVELEKSKEELNKYLADERQRVDILLMKVVPPPSVAPPPAPVPTKSPPATFEVEEPPPPAPVPTKSPPATFEVEEPPAPVPTKSPPATFEVEEPTTAAITKPEPPPAKNCCVIS